MTEPRDAAIARAHDQFRWFAGGWAVNADLPTPAGFTGASQFVRPEDVAEQIPCGPDLDAIDPSDFEQLSRLSYADPLQVNGYFNVRIHWDRTNGARNDRFDNL